VEKIGEQKDGRTKRGGERKRVEEQELEG